MEFSVIRHFLDFPACIAGVSKNLREGNETALNWEEVRKKPYAKETKRKMEGSQKNKEEREGICVTGVSKTLREGNETAPNWEGVRKKLTLTPGVLLRRGRFFACLFDLRLEKERNLSVNFKKYPFFARD